MILLVIGLAAVIVVLLIAVFLSIRLGRGDEHDEADLEPSGRERPRDQDERRQNPDTRRVSSSGSRGGRGSDYPGYDSRGPARGPRGRNSGGAPRRPSRDDTDYRKPAAARAPVGASAQARGRQDTGPSRRPATDDFPSADYPSMDFGPAVGYATGDQPSVATGYEAVDDARERPGSRRKSAPASASSKSKSRQRGKRTDDDDDWPSSEWDKLSDEQYWAELSADKPLSTMARPSRPANNGVAKAPANGSAKAKPPMRDSRPPRPAAADRDTQRDLPGRREHSDQREPVTEQLPARAARQATPSLPPSRREADAAAGRSYPDSRSVLDSGARPSRDTDPLSVRNTGPRALPDTGPLPLEPRRRDTTGSQRTRDRDLAALNGPASPPPPIPGALEDDPLTSPSFSLKAVPTGDSRSYSHARKHAKPAPDHFANGNGHPRNGHSGGYPAGDYADPGHAYQPAAHAAPAAAAADWYSAPPAPAGRPAEAPTSAYGNPYAGTGSGNGGSAAAHADSQSTGSYNNYPTDPLQGYSPAGYEAPARYTEPASSAAYLAAPQAAGSTPYANGYPAQHYPDQAGYQDRHSTGGYGHGPESGYTGDPHAPGGHAPYPPQG